MEIPPRYSIKDLKPGNWLCWGERADAKQLTKPKMELLDRTEPAKPAAERERKRRGAKRAASPKGGRPGGYQHLPRSRTAS